MGRVEIVALTVGARAKEGKWECSISSSLREVSTWRFREQIARSKKTPALQATVSISLTTLFRPFLSRLDSAVKTVNTSVSYNHSQVSRVSIARDANSLCDVWKFMSSNSLSCESIRFFGSSL